MLTSPQENEMLTLPPHRCWTIQEYEQAAKLGLFGPEEHLELIEGEIVIRMTQNSPHATAVSLALEALRNIFSAGYVVRVQSPITLGPKSQPDPDIAVVSGSVRDYATAHPVTALLIVEVSDTSLSYDRTTKAGLYARAGITEYWLLNLSDRALEVHRQPTPMTGKPLGYYYASVTRYTEEETISPLAASQFVIAIADLLP